MKIIIFALCVGIAYLVFFSDQARQEHAKREVEYAAQKKAEATPHVIHDVDGCKVYSFRDENTYRRVYFTRCANSNTVTQSDYTSGKTTETQTVPTTNAK